MFVSLFVVAFLSMKSLLFSEGKLCNSVVIICWYYHVFDDTFLVYYDTALFFKIKICVSMLYTLPHQIFGWDPGIELQEINF